MPVDAFMKQLHDLGLSPDTYLQCAKILARRNGYPTNTIALAHDGDHKLQITTPSGKIVRFGKATYGDYILHTWAEVNGHEPKGHAHEKRRLYHARAENIKGDWKHDPYSPNNLAIHVLW